MGVDYMKAVPTTDPNMTFRTSVRCIYILLFTIQLKLKALAVSLKNLPHSLSVTGLYTQLTLFLKWLPY